MPATTAMLLVVKQRRSVMNYCFRLLPIITRKLRTTHSSRTVQPNNHERKRYEEDNRFPLSCSLNGCNSAVRVCPAGCSNGSAAHGAPCNGHPASHPGAG